MPKTKPKTRPKATAPLVQDGEDAELAVALKLLRRRYGPGLSAKEVPFPGGKSFGKLMAFGSAEERQLTSMRSLIRDYARSPGATRPLCLAVFGPPGSGKSFAVEELRELALKELNDSKLKMPLTTLNMTQVSEPEAVARALARIAGEQDDTTIPIVFFDEFDAQQGGASFGWLSWFLAPMHDGAFLHDGVHIRLKRAIYVFAGGTASTMTTFSGNHTSEFRIAKGPDFVSRLRGFLDVEGPNANPRILRRALILSNELDKRAKRDAIRFRPTPNLLRRLLRAGRYIHGARSIAAVIELTRVEDGSRAMDVKDLPNDLVMELHVDRGVLDCQRLNGSIGLSGFGTDKDPTAKVASVWRMLARELWRDGATVFYAGGVKASGQDLRGELADEVGNLPRAVSRTGDERAPRLQSFEGKTRGGIEIVEKLLPSPPKLPRGLSDDDADWIQQSRTRFVARLQAEEHCVARFSIGGATWDYPGRFPGIVEELMLSLAMRKPVYLAGGFGGATKVVGHHLGIGRPWSAQTFKEREKGERVWNLIRDVVLPPPWDLPLKLSDVYDFFRKHAIDGSGWPDNGLTKAENHILFASKSPQDISKLVTKGLRRRFGRLGN